ncbi:MAG: hypothetical protein LWW85_15215, partial [Marinilabiliales bacterium]|nr:hypothetical protein [Marinilabiliales bacterium]
GVARVGLDDLLYHLTGDVTFGRLKNVGDTIEKEELLAEISKEGKQLKILSPISGEIIAINPMVNENPDLMGDDPYRKGWVYKIKPSRWIAETNSFYLAEEATHWTEKELERFKDFLASSVERYTAQPSNLILQDGGELIDQPLSGLPTEVWQDFQRSYLGTKSKYPHFHGLERQGYDPDFME